MNEACHTSFLSYLSAIRSIVPFIQRKVNSLPNNKILEQSNLKDFTNDKVNVTYVTNFVLGRVENIVRKGENAGYQHFLLF